MDNQWQKKAKEFLAISSQFKLGELPTETPHPETNHLSQWAHNDLTRAIETCKKIDTRALSTIMEKSDELEALKSEINYTLKNGHRVFICGCGATGRLALTLESVWRKEHKGTDLENKIVAFMAGGDIALISSIENFEDHPEYGARQLKELGFGEGDLLIGVTEGGETPFVIGATEEAVSLSTQKPYFLYCNPDEILKTVAKRSERVLNNLQIEKINLTVGPMVLAGSTRMQASSVQLAFLSLALFEREKTKEETLESYRSFLVLISGLDWNFLAPLIEREASIYLNGEWLYYRCDSDYAVTILSDTTERSPTFSLHPFENYRSKPSTHSLSYLQLPETKTSTEAWEGILERAPRVLNWMKTRELTGMERLVGFNFSREIQPLRSQSIQKGIHQSFNIRAFEGGVKFQLGDQSHFLDVSKTSFINKHIILKLLLNLHSTLVMGRMGRYDGNIMTWVKPSNNKLIDRTARYVIHLSEKKEIPATYERVVELCFWFLEHHNADVSIVKKILQRLEEENGPEGDQAQ